MTMSDEPPTSRTTVDIPVWINGSEKLVTGITKTTTCDDIIYSLLSNEGYRHADIESLNYVICERWHKVERPLSGRAKLGKVWKAWGPDRHNVKFSIKHVEMPAAMKVKQRHHRHRRRSQKEEEFFDPEKVRAEKTRLQTIEDLVQLVGEQQRKLQEQVERITETDREIETFETKTHLNRVKVRGSNYVQDSLFMSQSDDSSGLEDMNIALSATDFEMYLELCDKVVDLDSQISVHRNESNRLDNSLKIEISKPADVAGDNSAAQCEAQELRQRIHSIGCENEKLDRELYRVRTQITDRDIMIRRKQDFVDKLVEELAEIDDREKLQNDREKFQKLQNSPDSGKGKSPEREERRKQVTFQLPGESPGAHLTTVTAFPVLETRHSYSHVIDRMGKTNGILKYHHDSDSNSDTGLSSLHSDEAQVVLETLV